MERTCAMGLRIACLLIATLATANGRGCSDPNASVMSNPSGCPATCEKRKNTDPCLLPSPRRGCVCNPIYLIGPNGICVKIVDCPPLVCGSKEEYKNGAGDATCDNRTIPSGTNIPDCYCLLGDVRNYTGGCIPLDECPPTCGFNEELRYDTSDGTCVYPTFSTGVYDFGCYCLPDYVKKATGSCIPLENCPPKSNITCGTNEEYKEEMCDGTCEQPNKHCNVINHYDCFCISGFVRDNKGKCIPIDQCKNCKNRYWLVNETH